MPFFSVIIPLYNKENYIQATVESILNQEFQDFEIIIVNDCSTDKSLEMAQKITSEKIRYIQHEKNKGLSASRNTGIRNAKAQYVAFLDADDWWQPTYLKKIKLLIDNYPTASIFATAYTEVYPNEKYLEPAVNKKHLPKDETILIDDFFTLNLNQPLYNPSSVCYNKNIFDEVGFFDEEITFAEDVDFNIRANFNHALAYCNSIEMHYTVFSENQITTSGIKGKKIPDLNKHGVWESMNPSLKKYLDFERYVFARQCIMAEDKDEYKRLVNAIDFRNLTFLQRIFLKMPKSILLIIKKIKVFLLLKGWRVTSY